MDVFCAAATKEWKNRMLSVRWKNPVAASLLWRWISQLAYCHHTDIKRKFIRTLDRHLTAANLIRQVSAISFLPRSYMYTELDFDENKVQYISSKLWNRSIHEYMTLNFLEKSIFLLNKQHQTIQYNTRLFSFIIQQHVDENKQKKWIVVTLKNGFIFQTVGGKKTVSTRHLTNDSESKNQSLINLNASHTFPRNSIPRKENTPFQPSITWRKWRALDSLIIKKRKIP